MKTLKPLLAALVGTLFFGILGISAYQVPETVRIGLNAAALASSVSLECENGLYTDALFAAPEVEATERVIP